MAWIHDVLDGRKPKDLYQVLGCSQTSTQEQIKTEYKQRVLDCHPDLHPNDEASRVLFHELTEAYAILGDPAERKNYDAYQASGLLVPYDVWRKEQKEMHASTHWRPNNAPPSISQDSTAPEVMPPQRTKTLAEKFRDYEI